MIITKNISKYFGHFTALKNISFEIKKGEIVGFLGRNGAGKTTLMRILTSFISPSSGEVFIDGISPARDSIALRRKIGYLPERPPLYPDLTVAEYLQFAGQLKDIPVKDLKINIDRVLEECDLTEVRHKLIAPLSKGFKQRVGIAQAIIHNPQILILDEPTSGLDPIQNLQIRKLIMNLEEQRTVLISTHILSEIEQIAKRVLIIQEGEIIADNTLDALKQEHGQSSLEAVFLKLHSYMKEGS